MGGFKRLATFLVAVWMASMFGSAISSAADVCGVAIVLAADTVKLEGRNFRLDGVDAPETDQTCLEGTGAKWHCGIEARDQLSGFINGRRVCCADIGPDSKSRSRRIGRCSIGKENLSRWLVSQGWGLDLKPDSGGRFQIHETAALLDQRGMWRGCFVVPSEFRRWNIGTPRFLGARCPGNTSNIREQLFPADPDTPPGCPIAIKGKVPPFWIRLIRRYRGTYHMEACADYSTTRINRRKGDRWFCSEEEAMSEDFRKSQNCK
jgi:endonuclease YncB( thermonuclease family)